ncbi:hypothetical protein E3N88_23440 [Mikania micrantha]|uniref:Uncharacterized protein n=1 Tax=Mikania micrantha TaxID=192012 RepID=A0A5N6NEF4_9ASTR|nr:hypothetical protein E3N88_23440 [Mikania micrantha]
MRDAYAVADRCLHGAVAGGGEEVGKAEFETTSKERQPVGYLACPNKISNAPGLSKGCRRRSRKAAIQLRERLKDFRVCGRHSFWLRDRLDEAGKHE